jgi:hypothetical protein
MTERSFLAELKRRNVIRVAIAYVAVSWLVLQAATLLGQLLELPNAISKGLFLLLVIGFIPTLVFSWIYELTPEGLKRESEIERDESITHLTGRRLDYLVIGVLAAVVGCCWSTSSCWHRASGAVASRGRGTRAQRRARRRRSPRANPRRPRPRSRCCRS